jgi:hypothetical protein
MRRNIIPLLALSLSTATVSAQEIRLSGGYNASNVSEAGDEQWVGRAGYQFGADLMLGQRWFVKPGVHFLVRELRYTQAGTDDVPAQEFRYTNRSLSVPVLLGFNLMDPADDPGVNLYVMGGPTALMSLSADLDNDELDVETRGTQWYLGGAAGLSFGFLFIEGGYNAAMSNVFKGESFETNPKVNQGYAIAGVRLRLAN